MGKLRQSGLSLVLILGGVLLAGRTFAQVLPLSIFDWDSIDDGLSFCEIDAPEKSIINDSKLTIVRIDPSKYVFNFLTATEYGQKLRSADVWANEFDLEVVVNAGMYSPRKHNPNKGFLKNFDHVNNPVISGYYNAMLVSHPIDSLMPSFKIFDMTCDPYDSFKKNYRSFCQDMRMMDCEGNAMAFDKKPDQSCSMVLLTTDTIGMIYIVFSRSPYTHQTMIGFLKSFPLNLRQTAYLEGGPEASLYICSGEKIIARFGSYVSRTWARDDNDHFWDIPNVIGIRKR